jgi:hypothetical protein
MKKNNLITLFSILVIGGFVSLQGMRRRTPKTPEQELMSALNNRRNFEAISKILIQVQNVDAEDTRGFPLIVYALQYPGWIGNYVLEDLIKRGAHKNVLLPNGKLLFQFLLESGLDVDEKVEKLQLLLDHELNPNALNDNGDGMLFFAARLPGGSGKIIDLLRSRGATPHVANDNGNTPLHEAVKRNNVEAVQALLKEDHLGQKADPGRQNNKGESALDLAIKSDNNEIVTLLLGTPPAPPM